MKTRTKTAIVGFGRNRLLFETPELSVAAFTSFYAFGYSGRRPTVTNLKFKLRTLSVPLLLYAVMLLFFVNIVKQYCLFVNRVRLEENRFSQITYYLHRLSAHCWYFRYLTHLKYLRVILIREN